MRFLFTVSPMVGHFHALAPLALAVKERGHELAFATGRGFGRYIRQAGFQHFPCGFDFDGSQDIFQALPEFAALKAEAPADTALQQLHGFVMGLSPRMAADLIDLVEKWKPDAVVRDPLEYGGYIAAERGRIPHATAIWATYISTRHMLPGAFAELRRRFGLPPDPDQLTLDRFLVLDFLPPSWKFVDLPYPRTTHHFCAPPFDMAAGERLPDWLETLPDLPLVHATLGTAFNQAPALFNSILQAFSDLPLNLVMTVGRSMDPRQFGKLPANIHIEQYIPQSLLLPRCAALVFHGGYNTLRSALWHALPMLVIPAGAGDQWPTARRVAEIGAGLMLHQEPPGPQEIRTALTALLEQPAYRRRLADLHREMMALPPIDEAVNRLERLATDQDPQF